MKCPHCGQEHPNQVTYCPVTGNQIIAFECPRCGEVVMASTAFCPFCGLDLGEPDAPAPRRRLVYILAGLGVIIAGILAVIILPRLVGLFLGNITGGPQSTLPFPGTTIPVGTGLIPQILTATAEAGQIIGTTSTPKPAVNPTQTVISLVPPACTTAGQTWVRPSDQMNMECVPAGNFTIGMKTCVFQGCGKEVNGGSQAVTAYWIDQTEVTNAMFGLFVTATNFLTGAEKTGASEVNGIAKPVNGADWLHPQGPDSSIDGKNDHPVVQVNWFAAFAYCQWAGGSLPTELQWEKAARGTDGRLFPWGNSLPDASRLNAADSNSSAAWANHDQDDGFRYTAPVRSYPSGSSPFGAADLAGNAWEWTRSLYKDYPYNPTDGREITSSAGVTGLVVIRGGGFYDDYGSVRSTLRYGGMPGLSHDATGFRCVYP
jgi:formylglycine-generating enzyme required for sulfatase activity